MSTPRERAESLLRAPPTPTVVSEIRKLVDETRRGLSTGSGMGALSERQVETITAYAEAYHAFRGKQFEAFKAYALISAV